MRCTAAACLAAAGKCRNVARLTPRGSVVIEYDWDAPYAGNGRDELQLDDQGRLIYDCTVVVDGQTAGYRQVYHRKS